MILALQIALAIAYAPLAHVASTRGDQGFGFAALLALIGLVLVAPLLQRRPWAWLAAAIATAGAWWLYRHGFAVLPLLVVPVLFVLLVAWVFGRSLGPGREPLIARIVSGLDGVPPAQLPADVYRSARVLMEGLVRVPAETLD